MPANFIQSIVNNSQMSKAEKFDTIAEAYASEGYSIINKSENQLLMTKKKQFNTQWAVWGALLCGVGLILYLIYYTFEDDKTINIYFVENRDDDILRAPLHQQAIIQANDRRHYFDWLVQLRRNF